MKYIFVILITILTINSSFASIKTGDSLYDKGEYKLALNEYLIDDLTNFTNLNNIGICYYLLSDYDNAIIYYLKALKVAKFNNDLIGQEKSSNNIGIVYLENDDYNKALKYLENSLYLSINRDDKLSMSYSYNNIGLCYYGLQEYEKSLINYNKSAELSEQINNKPLQASIYTNIGNVYRSMKKYNNAINFYNNSLDMLNNFESDIYLLSSNYNNISTTYNELGKYKKSNEYAIKSIKYADSISNIKVLKSCYDLLYNNYENLEVYDSSLFYHKKYVELKDSIYNDNKMKTIYSLEAKYQSELKDSKIEILNKDSIIAEKEIEKKNTVINFAIFSIVIFIIIALIIFIGYKRVKKLNVIVSKSKKQVEKKNKDITDSLNYAKRIQKAMLSKYSTIKYRLNESFILFKPKDIVSGDFYWVEEKDNTTLFSIADCTGHGVPGAFMSFIGHNGLNKIVNENGELEPGEILNQLNIIVKNNFSYSEETVRDGMDMTLCSFNNETNILKFSGANNPIYIVRESDKGLLDGQTVSLTNNGVDLYKIKGDKAYIGGAKDLFNTTTIKLQEGDTVYLFTDGYADQFGGQKGKKFMYKRFQKLLTSNFHDSLDVQKKKLQETIENWMIKTEQIDDISVMGFRV